MLKKYFIVFSIALASCSSGRNAFSKYDLEEGIVIYSVQYALQENPVEQKVYFTHFGATEYIDYLNKRQFKVFPILKQDDLQYVFVTDSMTVTSDRNFDFLFEKLIKKKGSALSNDDLVILKKSDTLAYGKKCELIEFKITSTGQKGKAALWKGIPLWANSEIEEGLYESLHLIELDLTSKIPVEKTKLMDYIDKE